METWNTLLSTFFTLLFPSMYWNLSISLRWTLKFLTTYFKYKIMFLGIWKKILMKQIIFTLTNLFLKFFMETIFLSVLLEVFPLHSLCYVVTAFMGIISSLTPHNLQFPANHLCSAAFSVHGLPQHCPLHQKCALL